MTTDPLLRPLHTLLNRQMQRSTPAKEAAGALDGRTLAVGLQNTGITLFFTVVDGQLELSRDFDEVPDAVLKTSVLGLARMGSGKAESGTVEISGDPVVAQQFESLLRHARPDLEEELSRLVGDVAAHQLANSAKGLFNFCRQAAQSLGRNSAEFLSEERGDVVSSAQVEAFNDEVTELARDVAKMAQRISALEPKT